MTDIIYICIEPGQAGMLYYRKISRDACFIIHSRYTADIKMVGAQVKSTIEQCHPGILIAILLILPVTVQPAIAGQKMETLSSIKLPEPRTDHGTSVKRALRLRKSHRDRGQ
ncbi:MAG: hypothetical protein WBO34_10890 [Gammaproteobacteria bacterium]